MKRLEARRRLAWLGVWLPAAVTCALIGLVVAIGIAAERGALPTAFLSRQADRLMDWSGLALTQVSISGLRHTAEADVYAALELSKTRTLLGLDTGLARQRIESLPWVESARVTRIYPDGLDVTVVERRPIAVWKLGDSHAIIDRKGRPIAAVAADAMPGLPRVIGEGAEKGARALLDGVAQYPDLLARLQSAERRSDGRWSLRLRQGHAVHLPAANEGEAIARAAVLVAAGLADRADIDLREDAPPMRLRRSAGRAPAGPALPLAAGRT
ncbi:MAG: FtsQ-type POTRA domain-containing protein [Hyphomicrobiaceae bacterium]|nr:FtsQ-type POTRA domain-containing protein [Hyphomicrobiaceae bacterium]